MKLKEVHFSFALIQELEKPLDSLEGYERPITPTLSVSKIMVQSNAEAIVRQDAQVHFESQGCEFYGPIKRIPAIELSEDGKVWRTAVFPETYPFITLRKNVDKPGSISETDKLYERLIFGDLGNDYTVKTGVHFFELLDFDTSEWARSSWAINPDTELPLGEHKRNWSTRCKRLKNAY